MSFLGSFAGRVSCMVWVTTLSACGSSESESGPNSGSGSASPSGGSSNGGTGTGGGSGGGGGGNTGGSAGTGGSGGVTVPPLPELGFPVPLEVAPHAGQSYDGASTITLDGSARLERVPDPNGSGRNVFLRRIVRSDHAGGTVSCRNEFVWNDAGPMPHILPGDEVWGAFAFMPKGDEWVTASATTDNDMLVFQSHSESNGPTQPDIALFVDRGLDRMYWQRSWSAAPQATTPVGTSKDWIFEYPAAGIWHKFVFRWKLGFDSSHAPATQVWYKKGDLPWELVVDKTASTDFNTYNWDTGSYLRIGFYKWSGTEWAVGSPTIAMYETTLYAERGSDLLERAEQSLAGL